MSRNALATALGVPVTRIHEIVKERRSITADTAERLARYFGGDAASWLALQAMYDLKTLPTRQEIIDTVQQRVVEPTDTAVFPPHTQSPNGRLGIASDISRRDKTAFFVG